MLTYQKALTWKLEWEFQSFEHDGEPNPPSARASNKKASASSLLQLASKCYVAVRDLPVSASNEAECEHKREKEEEEYDIRAQRQNEVKEAKQAHNKEEEGKAGVEANTLETGGRVRGRCGIRSPGVEPWYKGTSETEPEST